MSLPSIGANNVNPLLLKAQTTKTPSAGTETVIVLPEANMPDSDATPMAAIPKDTLVAYNAVKVDLNSITKADFEVELDATEELNSMTDILMHPEFSGPPEDPNMPDNRYSFGTYKHNINGEVKVYYITFVSEGGEWLPLWIQDEATGKKEHF